MDELRVALRRAGETIADYREALPEARVTPVAGRHDVRRSLERIEAVLLAVAAERQAAG